MRELRVHVADVCVLLAMFASIVSRCWVSLSRAHVVLVLSACCSDSLSLLCLCLPTIVVPGLCSTGEHLERWCACLAVRLVCMIFSCPTFAPWSRRGPWAPHAGWVCSSPVPVSSDPTTPHHTTPTTRPSFFVVFCSLSFGTRNSLYISCKIAVILSAY